VTLAPTSTPTRPALSQLTPYQRRLFVFLGVANFFEGYDYIALTQILPTLGKEFGLSERGTGVMVGAIGLGAILAYLLVRRADVVGRRNILAVTIAGYTLFSLLSALAQDAFQFGAAQLGARTFLMAEYSVSMVYLAEEFPADRRGFAVGVIQGLNSLGSIMCAGLVPMLLKTPWGFRSVYVVGTVPLLLMMFLRRNVQETRRFSELAQRGAAKNGDFLRVFRTAYAARVGLLALIWGLTYLCTYLMVTYWKTFAVRERGFDDVSVAKALMIAALGSLPLVFVSGKLLDLVGRRRGASIIFSTASAGTLLAFLPHGFWMLTLGLTLGIFSASAVLPVLTSFTLELFPTELRADAYAWVNNLLGRISYVLGPVVLGVTAERFGYGPCLAVTALFPMCALALILAKLPETAGKELEETSALN
jgi:putative MFS transporter